MVEKSDKTQKRSRFTPPTWVVGAAGYVAFATVWLLVTGAGK